MAANRTIQASRFRSDMVVSTILFIIFLLILFTFINNKLSDTISNAIDPLISIGSSVLYLAIVLFVFAVVFLDIGNESKLRTVMYISWALFLPSVLYFSRIDLLLAINSPINFSSLSSNLPSFIVILAGMALVCGELMLRSLSDIQDARKNLIDRGADLKEVNSALDKNMAFEASVIAASGCIVLAIIFLVPAIEPLLLSAMQSSEYLYIISGIGAVIVLIATILLFLRPGKNNSDKR